MADGTSVGKIYMDLVIKDTIQQQVQSMTAKAQAQMQQSMNGIEKSITETMDQAMSKAAKNAQKAATKTAEMGQQMADSIGSSFDKSVALAQVRVKELEAQLARTTRKLQEAKANDNDTAAKSLADQQTALYDRLEAARERLAINVQAAAQKQAAAEQAAAQKAAAAAEAAAAKQQEAVKQAHSSADPPEQYSFSRIRDAASGAFSAVKNISARTFAAAGRAANRFGNIASKTFSGAKKLVGSFGKAISSLKSKFSSAGKSASGFGRRLKGIVSGALVFNGISAGLRKLTEYFKIAVTSSGSMQDALANLKGAAATAAAPFVELLTPALIALTNAAATAFSYLSRLISAFTGKTLSSMSSSAKKMQSTAGAAKKAMSGLAGFDQIQKLDSNDDSGSGSKAPNFEFQGQSSFLDSVLASVQSGDWGQIGALISQKLNAAMASVQWPNIREKIAGWGTGIAQAINGFAEKLDFAYVGSTISNALNTVIGGINSFFQNVDWTGIGSGIGTGLSNMFSTLDWGGVGVFLTNGLCAALQGLHGFVGSFDFSSLGTELATATMAAINNVDWVQGAKDLGKAAIGLFQMLTKWITGMDWQQVGNTIANAVAAVDWGGLVSSLVEGIGAACAGLAKLLWGIVEDAWNDLVQWWNETAFEDGQFTVEGLLNGIGEALRNIGSWINKNIFEPFKKGFCEAFGIHSPSRFMADMGKLLIDGLFAGISKTWTNIATFFTNAFQSVKKAIVNIWQNGIIPAIKGPINSIIGFLNGMISGICQGINTIIRAMNKLKWDIPDWVPILGGKSFGFNLAEISAPKIPMLANGGVITQPTLAMMGEYAGARNNPEIVSPKSLIEQTVADAMREYHGDMVQCFDAVVSVLKDILEAVLEIEIDGETLYSIVKNESKMHAIRTGGGGW